MNHDDAARLERAILAGPPVGEMYSKDADPALLEKAADYEVLLRLQLLKSGRALSSDAQATLDRLSQKYQDWKPGEDERDTFPFYMTSGFGGREPKVRVPGDRSELVSWLKANPKRAELQEDEWFEYCQKQVESPAAALLELAAQGDWTAVDRWRTALQAWGTEKDAGQSWEMLGLTVSEAPAEVITTLASALGWWLQAVSKIIGPEPRAFSCLVLRLLRSYAETTAMPEEKDLNDALNHPVGLAMLATTNWWFRQNLQDGQGLSDVVRPAWDEVTRIEVPSYRPGRAILSMSVVALFRVDTAWTREHLLSRFDWKASQTEALTAWKGFLHAPRLHPPLIAAFKAQFLATADHYALLGEHAQQYAAFLAYAALELREGISSVEFAKAIQKLPSEGLAQAVRAVSNALEAAGDKREAYWANRVAPFFKSVWPKSLKFNTEQVSKSIAHLCLRTRQAFPDALKELSGYLQRFERPDELVLQLQQEKLCETAPAEALDFLDKVVGDDARFISPESLEQCLNAVVKARPDFEADRKVARLREIRRRGYF